MNTLGRRVLALALAVFGILYLLHAVIPTAFFPGPPLQFSASPLVNAVAGLLFVAAGAVLGVPKGPPPLGVGVATLLFLYTACLHWPGIFSNPANPQPWTSTGEIIGLASGCLVATASGVRLGRILYGLSLVAFAVLHVRYHAFVASMVPGWYPMNAIWPYVTAVGFLAGAISYLSGFQVRLASFLLAAMYLVFALTLHAPDVFAHPTSGGRWTGLFVSLGFASGALLFGAGSGSRAA